MTGALGWKPGEFWASSVHDCNLALEGYAEEVTAEMERRAELTAVMINGVFEANRAKRFRPKKGSDIFRRKPAAEQRAEQKGAADSYRERLRKAPQTLPFHHFNGRPSPPRGS